MLMSDESFSLWGSFVNGALCRENKQGVTDHNTFIKQTSLEGKIIGKLIMGFS